MKTTEKKWRYKKFNLFREQKQNEFEERMQEREEKQKVYKELKAKRQKVFFFSFSNPKIRKGLRDIGLTHKSKRFKLIR